MGSSVLVSVSVMSLPRHPSEGWDLVDLGRRVRSARGSARGPEIPAFAGMTAVGDGASEIALLLLLLRSEEHTSELQSLMRISYAVFCLKKKNNATMNA